MIDIIDTIYEENIGISEDDLLAKIIHIERLTPLDLWLLPQYVFDEWRKKHDYPIIFDNFKRRLKKFDDWMKEYSLSQDILFDGYISSFIENKYTENKEIKTKHLLKVTYKNRTKYQVWDNYEVDFAQNDDEIEYEYVKEFLGYLDWCENKNIDSDFLKQINRYGRGSEYEEVFYNFDLRLLKMGGIEPPTNGLNQILRPKKIEFVNVNGLKLNEEISNNQSIEFNYCTIDNLTCKHLKILFITFRNTSVQNLNMFNSQISNWKFINSNVTGRITDSSMKNIRIWGGQFIPIFQNADLENFGVWFSNIKHSENFDRTFRALYKANNELGNYKIANDFKIKELDYKRLKAKGFKNKIAWNFDKYFWGYGREPKRILIVIFLTILIFAFIYSVVSKDIIPKEIDNDLSYFEKFCYGLYCSIISFVTLGFSDIFPRTGITKIIVSIEAIIGALSMGAFVVSLTKIKD
ncbi:Ion channel [Chryseobacterium carnipullorum]|uniref:potassium channel family protein n=1 Tax=Chryseobacterium carnipullorum TaxID=1124835 RepID=UPI000919483A|nr:potassium channel family protein [Chryseobacterium carnipullorum]SHM23971.1 Ion channel [Chryseobacterium carnipullorum]